MDQTAILKLVQKELEELGLLLQGFDGMGNIPQPIKTLTISKAEHLLDALRKLEYSREEDVKTLPIVQPEIIQKENTPVDLVDDGVGSEPVVHEDVPVKEPVVENLPKEEPKEEPHETPVMEFEPAIPEVKESVEIVEEQSTIVEKIVEKAEVDQAKTAHVIKQSLGDSIKTGAKVGDRLMGDQRSSLGSRMEGSAIKDLKKAISIADRFRYQRELFQNNADLMNSTVERINSLPNLDAAISMINEEFSWDDALESKKDFLNLMMRRFL